MRGVSVDFSTLFVGCSSRISYLTLKKYHQGDAHVIQWYSLLLDQNMTFEEELVTILDRQISKLRFKEIASVMV